MLQRSKTTSAARRRNAFGSVVVAAAAVAALASAAPASAAEAGWSRTPGSGLAGGTVRVASSSTTLCRWTQPAAVATAPDPSSTDATPTDATGRGDTPAVTPAADPVTYDGTSVQVRLSRDGVAASLGTLPVTPGGAWSGTVTVPDRDVVAPGDYDLIVRCVVDRPELDGVRTYDFDPLPFTVVEGPPPTTVEIPTELVPPLTVTNPVQVEGEQITRPAATPAPATATAATPTLPNTGDGTFGVAMAGLGALLVGGGALWWGARHSRRHPAADLVD